jgi:hypothetical protein
LKLQENRAATKKRLANNDTAGNGNRLIGFHDENTMPIIGGKIKGGSQKPIGA